MNNQIIEQLGRILNTLTLIETSGKNTLLMADCIRALDEVCQVMSEEMQDTDVDKMPFDPEVESEIGE